MIRLLTGLEFPGAPNPELQRQPAGFDLTVQSVDRLMGRGALDLTGENRRLPQMQQLPWPEEGPLRLNPGGYLVTYNETVQVPDDCAGLVLSRSSLLRCGAVLHTALWDPGYKGRGQGLLCVYQELQLYRDARLGQFILLGLDQTPEETYSGTYQGENL